MANIGEQREALEEVVRLLESVRDGEGIGAMERRDFDDGRADGYVVTSLSAAKAALGVAARRESQLETGESGA